MAQVLPARCPPYTYRQTHGTRVSHLLSTTLASSNLVQNTNSRRRSPLAVISDTDTMTRANSGNATVAERSIPGMQVPVQVPMHRVRTFSYGSSRRQSMHAVGSVGTIHLHWLFRSNIPRRRGMPLPNDVRKRNFFGVGEIIGVLANPSETLRSLAESKRMLEEARRELAEARERAQLSPTHTFSSLPGFFDRPAELRAVERALEGEPSFTILFGASSVGKTALLRQVLTRPKYHVLHFDLRIAGFADLASLYMSLSQQMEAFFMSIAQDPDMPGYGDFEKDAWGFKFDRLNVERRLATASQSADAPGANVLSEIKTSDVARLMELFQSSLLRYWNFQPKPRSRKASVDTDTASVSTQKGSKPSWRSRMFWGRRKETAAPKENGSVPEQGEAKEANKRNGKERAPEKKIPVFVIDEAHKLPALIRSADAMKCLLDAMLVLTKQDRLCHVIHATSDPFYQTWLRQLNVMQHCKIITIGDYPKSEARRFFRERILPSVPERLRLGLDFERLYDAFGGKLAHWQDYITDYVNMNGKLEVRQSSHFLQAHALLNLHIIHSAQAPPRGQAPEGTQDTSATTPQSAQEGSARAIHRLSPPPGSNTGFRIYSPLTASPHGVPPTAFATTAGEEAPEFQAEFTALQLLKVMNRLAQPGARSLPYFLLCREMGVRAVDGMVKGRILDLRWTEPVAREGAGADARISSMRVRESIRAQIVAGSSGTTAVNEPEGAFEFEDGEMVPMSDEEVFRAHERLVDARAIEDEEDVVGPKLVPITPIMRFAMREVVQEYYDDDDQTVSEYASLSEVEEY